MTVACQLCHVLFRSDKPELEAQQDVLEQITAHLGHVHRAEAKRLAILLTGVQRLAATYLLIKQFVAIPPCETALLESFDQNEDALIESLGLEAESEEVPT